MSKKKKKKRVVLKIRNILIFLFIVVFLGILLFIILNMPVKNIYVTGNSILSDDIVLNDSKLVDYPSFLLTSSYEIKNNLKRNKYVRDVKVKKKFGNVIELYVYEYTVLASIEKDDKLIISSGDIIDNDYDISDVPILVNSINDKMFSNFVKKFSEIDSNILRQISEIEYSPVTVDDSKFLLYMSDGNLVYVTLTKIDKLNKYNIIKDKLGNKTGIIYLDSGNYFELKDNKGKAINDSIDDLTEENNNLGANG